MNQSINIVFTTTGSVVFSAPQQQITFLDSTNTGFLRQMLVSNNGITIQRGSSVCRIPTSQLYTAAVTADPTLTWPPSFNLSNGNPTSSTVTHPGTASFVVSVSSEITPTQYIWQDLSSSATTWNNTSLTASIFSGNSTVALTASCLDTSLNGYQFRCVATSSAGITTSSVVVLTVL